MKVVTVTPKGTVEWFSLQTPDKYGAYTCNLILADEPDTHKFISKIKELGKENLPFKKQDDGSYKVKLKLKSSGTKKDGSIYNVKAPVVYDGTGTVIDPVKLGQMSVGNGSVIRAKVTLSDYEFAGRKGVSCKPISIQIAKLVEFNGGGDTGFDALEFSEFDSAEFEPSTETASSDDF